MKRNPSRHRILLIATMIGFTAVLTGCVITPDHAARTTETTTSSQQPALMPMPMPGTVTTQTTHTQTVP
ncbi:hypothetical protein AiwAL_00135 [Acidiphilium sp. AL]|uniref:hypothetical protein n=2 Tax=Acidiphilium TaxID=522 RepID=UPI0021CB48CC|nr:hypothetical protein [Acidiphilium sp. AL]MCU4158515.1 hypothetical protein [Acidiphilium sp. AL]